MTCAKHSHARAHSCATRKVHTDGVPRGNSRTRAAEPRVLIRADGAQGRWHALPGQHEPPAAPCCWQSQDQVLPSINQPKTSESFSRLTFEKTRDPSRVGASVLGLDDVYAKLRYVSHHTTPLVLPLDFEPTLIGLKYELFTECPASSLCVQETCKSALWGLELNGSSISVRQSAAHALMQESYIRHLVRLSPLVNMVHERPMIARNVRSKLLQTP